MSNELHADEGRHYALDGLGWTIHYTDRRAAARRYANEWPEGPYVESDIDLQHEQVAL